MDALKRRAAKDLGVRIEHVVEISLVKRSLDSRKRRGAPAWVHVVDLTLTDRVRRSPRHLRLGPAPAPPPPRKAPARDLFGLRAAVVGTGPAGLFAALCLAERGAAVTVFEQGPPLEERVSAVRDLWRLGKLVAEANVQFGEGGAGTFSDGKLTTRVKDPLAREVLQVFVECGSPPAILEEAHPHLGTDGVRAVVRRMRGRLESLGARFRFKTAVSDVLAAGRGCELATSAGPFSADVACLALGHSSRRLVRRLAAIGVPFRAKGFAVGVRLEHPQAWVDERQHGSWAGHPDLSPAEYFLTFKDVISGRGVFSFCMCPGGLVVNSASEPCALVTNGMSLSRRASGFANAGFVVTVAPEDFAQDPLAGIAFQEELEAKGFAWGGGGFFAPAQTLRGLLEGRADDSPPKTTYRPGVRAANLRGFFPGWAEDPLARALSHFDSVMPGFVERGVMIAPETRTSSPAQVVRDEAGSVLGFPRLYLLGEGAGWAGGIVSSAVDALRCLGRFRP